MVCGQSRSFFLLTVLLTFSFLLWVPAVYSLEEQVALINGQSISFEKFRMAFDKSRLQLEAESPIDPTTDEGKKILLIAASTITDELINNFLLEAAAGKLGLGVSAEEIEQQIAQVKNSYPDAASFEESLKTQNITVEELKENLHQRFLKEKIIAYLVKDISITEREMKNYYQKNLSFYILPERIELSHLLVFSEYRGLAVLDEINLGLSFEQAVRRYSEDSPTKSSGGYLGFRKRKDFPPSEANLLFQLTPGGVSPLLKTAEGYEIFKCLSYEQEKVPDFAEVKERIKKALYEEKKETAYKAWFKKIRDSATIEVNDPLTSSYIFGKNAQKTPEKIN